MFASCPLSSSQGGNDLRYSWAPERIIRSNPLMRRTRAVKRLQPIPSFLSIFPCRCTCPEGSYITAYKASAINASLSKPWFGNLTQPLAPLRRALLRIRMARLETFGQPWNGPNSMARHSDKSRDIEMTCHFAALGAQTDKARLPLGDLTRGLGRVAWG
jgi:hypothetical protein